MLTRVIPLFFWLIPLWAAAAQPVLSNQLAGHPSPYLALHQSDPVHWQVWSAETLSAARTLNRPLLISIGYFSCHWCHVMQRESYQDAELAKRINDGFVPVKVDRELQPALDAYLMDFVRITRGQAGWPLNVFLTPEGYPLLGVTYLSPDEFSALLENLQQRWRTDPAQLRALARNALLEWQGLRDAASAHQPDGAFVSREMVLQVAHRQDEIEGGFGQQAKFPMVAQLQALLWMRERRGERSLDEFLRLTLDRMAERGLHDLLGGGFFRYVVDPSWQTPHYEKMLYDNAQLALLYLRAADQFQSPGYRDIGLRTADFMLREMRGAGGYFISSFSAVDALGREGRYYLWNERELETLLNKDELRAVSAAWFDGQDAGSEYGRLPRWRRPAPEVAKQLGWKAGKLDQVLEAARGKLLQARAQRSLPADTKGVAAWNGLALSALAAAYRNSHESRYAEAAEALVAYLLQHWWDGERLVRAVQGEQVLAPAALEDYALVAQGLWDWSRAKPGGVDEKLIGRLLRKAWQQYYADGRWVQDDAPLIPTLEGRVALEDGSLPSATAIIAALSRELEALREDDAINKLASTHLEQVRTALGGSVFSYPSYLKLLDADQPLR